ncbi:hypothetical protein S83_047653 [Arachis hypogaea]
MACSTCSVYGVFEELVHCFQGWKRTKAITIFGFDVPNLCVEFKQSQISFSSPNGRIRLRSHFLFMEYIQLRMLIPFI